MKKRFMQLALLAVLMLTGNTVIAQSIPDMSEWSFSTSTVTIDNNRYFLDNTNNLAEFLVNYTNSSTAESFTGTFTVPSKVNYGEKEYTVVSMKMYSWSYDLVNVDKVVLPNTLVNLGDYALSYFPKVKTLEIPASVKYMGNRVVNREWSSIKFLGITPPEVKGQLSSENKVKVIVPAAGFQEYKVTDYIEDCCVISDDISTQTFHTGDEPLSNGELGYVVVANQLPDIITYSDVNKLIIDAGSIDVNDWYQIRQMKNLIHLDLSGLSITDIPYEALSNCWQIETVILPATLKAIHGYAFYRTGIRDLVFPESLEIIDGSYNFANCDFLTSISIPNGVKSLPSYCFYDCNNLQHVTLPDRLEAIGSNCFEYCNLLELYVPGTLKNISYAAFSRNANMASLTLSEGIETIGTYAFLYCNSLSTITFPSSLRRINSEAFCNDASVSKLSAINFNEGLEEIDYRAFANNKLLTEITLPSSLIYCLDYPFDNCTGIQKIYTYALIPPTVRNYVITRYAGNIELYVPQWSFQEYMTTPGWLEFQDHLSIDPNILPENIIINKEFEFVLKPEQMKEGYHPNMRLLYNTESIDDGFGHQKYERGNLTVSSRSMLSVNNFTMNISPMAKLYSDYNRFNNNRNYDDHRTQFSPSALVIRGSMRADHQVYNLMVCNDRWQFISFPFDVKVSDIKPVDPLTQWTIRRYDGAARAAQDFDNTWVTLSEDAVLEAGKGYILKCYHSDDKYYPGWNYQNNPIEFTVTPVEKALTTQQLFDSFDRDITLAENISEFEQNRSWNLIGNPYPCFFDSRYMQTDSPFLVWDTYNKTYAAFSPIDDDYVLEPGEAFFIQRPVNDGETLRFRQDGRQTYRNPNDLAVPARAMKASARRTIINLVLSDDNNSDRTRIVFNDEALMKYETSRDAAKFMADGMVPQLWSVGGSVQYAINERPANDGTVELAARFFQEGNYTISLGSRSGVESIVLEDRLTGTRTELSAEQSYTFNAQPGTATGRFFIVSANVTTGISEISNAASETPAYNMAGQRVNSYQRGIIVKNGKKILNK